MWSRSAATEGSSGSSGIIAKVSIASSVLLQSACASARAEQGVGADAPESDRPLQEADGIEMPRHADQGFAGSRKGFGGFARRHLVVCQIPGGTVEVTGLLDELGRRFGRTTMQLSAQVAREHLVGDLAEQRVDGVVTAVGALTQQTCICELL